MLVTSWAKNVTSETFQNTFILKRPRVVIFADIIKVVIIFIKTIFKTQKKIKRIRNYSQSSIYICFSSCNKVCRFSVKNADVSRSQRVFYMIFGSSLGVTVPSLIIIGYIWQISGRGRLFAPHPWTMPKWPILKRVKNCGTGYSLDYNLNSRKHKRNCSELKKRIMSRYLQ